MTMAKRTNKTDHVLNLLASGVKNQPAEPEEEKKDQAPAVEEETAGRQAAEEEPPVTVVQNTESDVSEQVRAMLEEELARELNGEAEGTAEAAPEPEAAPVEKAAPEPEAAPVEKAAPEPEAAPVQKAAPEETEPAQEEEPDFVMVNVMETLIRKNVDDYMKKFNVCRCARCKADVMALALTEKPSKYVVVQPHAVAPLLNFFEARNRGEMTSRLARACTMVSEKPRH